MQRSFVFENRTYSPISAGVTSRREVKPVEEKISQFQEELSVEEKISQKINHIRSLQQKEIVLHSPLND